MAPHNYKKTHENNRRNRTTKTKQKTNIRNKTTPNKTKQNNNKIPTHKTTHNKQQHKNKRGDKQIKSNANKREKYASTKMWSSSIWRKRQVHHPWPLTTRAPNHDSCPAL